MLYVAGTWAKSDVAEESSLDLRKFYFCKKVIPARPVTAVMFQFGLQWAMTSYGRRHHGDASPVSLYICVSRPQAELRPKGTESVAACPLVFNISNCC